MARANIACDSFRFMDNYGFTRARLFCYIRLSEEKKDVSHLSSDLGLHSGHRAGEDNREAFFNNFLTPSVIETLFKDHQQR